MLATAASLAGQSPDWAKHSHLRTMNDKTTFRQQQRELTSVVDEYSDIATSHMKGQSHNLAEANWPPGAIRDFDDDGSLADDVDSVTVEVYRTFDVDAPAHRYQALLDDLADLGADVDTEVVKTKTGAPPRINDAGNAIPRGAPSSEATPTYIKLTATLDLTDDLGGQQ